ncbi:MAG: serine/threonine protein kinase, partial [Myxococcales bacterium]|nr:serine/threonine protein kinase [Myxococcales bacterium]
MRDDHDERSEGDADPLARTMPRDPEDTTSPEASSAFEAADSSEAGSAPEQAGSSDESTHVGRYRLIDKLGEGSMGMVYLAHDEQLDRRVAIKLLRPDSGGDPRRLLREARSMARLSHPHIAAVHDVGTHGGDVYVAMEYVDGPTLREWMRQPHPWAERREVLLQAARGLAAAHASGIVHRDFKPDNVIVGVDGRVRVLDFGLAKLAPRARSGPIDATSTADGNLVGTPRYMAPEQLRTRPAWPASDQFSLCVTA